MAPTVAWWVDRKGVEEMPMMDAIRSFLTRLGELTATLAAFGVLFAYFCLWLIFEHASLDTPWPPAPPWL